MDACLSSTTEALLSLIRQKLGEAPLDFSQKWQAIGNNRQPGERLGAAGVLLLIHDRSAASSANNRTPDLVFQLIKRSNRVSQGGDISCPGGFLNPRIDQVLAWMTMLRILPVMHSPARDYARRRPDGTYRIIHLFLANAMREAWEEIRLNPFNIDFLGPLPTYDLYMFQRTIFPLVACVKTPWRFKPNAEVDKVLEIPFRHFFDDQHYAWFSIESSYARPVQAKSEFPCFVFRDEDGHPDILWGATFNIVQHFLKTLCGFQLPAIPPDRSFTRMLTSEYVTGRRDDVRKIP